MTRPEGDRLSLVLSMERFVKPDNSGLVQSEGRASLPKVQHQRTSFQAVAIIFRTGMAMNFILFCSCVRAS